MEITPLRNNDSLYRIVETINQLVDSKNPELSISNTLVSAANLEKVNYTATDDTFITGEVFTITIPGMYQIYTKGVGRSKYAIKHIKDNSYIQSEEKADAYISDEYLLSAGDQVFFWAVGASHQELTITLKLTASFYDIIERLLKAYISSNKQISHAITLDIANWHEDSTNPYPFYYDIAVTGLKNRDRAEITIVPTSIVTAITCGLCPTNETLSGKIRIRSKYVPVSNIDIEYWIEKECNNMSYGPVSVGSGAGTAADISYDNTNSTLEAGNVQEAVDAVNTALGSKLDSANPVMTGEVQVVNGSNGNNLVKIDKNGHINFTNGVVIGSSKTVNGSVLSVGENPGLQYCSHGVVAGNRNQSYSSVNSIMAGEGNYNDGNNVIMVGRNNAAGAECESIVVGWGNLLSANEELFKVVSYTTTTLAVDPTFNKNGISKLANSSYFIWPCVMTSTNYAALPFYIKSYDTATNTITFKTEIPNINSYNPKYFIATCRFNRAQSEGAVFGFDNTLCGSSYIMGKFNNVCGYANFVTGYDNTILESGTTGSRHNFIAGEHNKSDLDIYDSSGMGNNLILSTHQHVFGHYNRSVTGASNSSTSGSALIIGNGGSVTRSNCFRVQYNGAVYSQGAYNTSGADYAELFEWEDGNPNNEDHRGKFVALSGRKIHIAKPGEIPIGVISSTAAIIGNNHSETWQGMYLRDIWGDVLTEYKEIPAETETIQHPAEAALDEDGNEVIVREAWEETRIIKPEFKGMVPVLNPDYNPEDTYIPRHERKEWGIVGLYGQLIVIDDGSCQVNGYCTCTENGTATSSENGYLVIERLDDTHIRILSNFLNTQQQVDTLKEETLSTMEAVTQVYEQSVESGDTAVTSMEAITQNYESILELQATVQKLQEEIQMLKGV